LNCVVANIKKQNVIIPSFHYKLINSYSPTLPLKSYKIVKPIYESNFNNIHYSQAKRVTITIQHIAFISHHKLYRWFHLTFLNIKITFVLIVSYFLKYLRYETFLTYASSHTIFIKLPIAAITKSALRSIVRSKYVLTIFILVGYISGVTLCLYMSHRNAYRTYYFPWDFHWNLSYKRKHIPQKDKYASVYTVSYNCHKSNLSTRNCSATTELYLITWDLYKFSYHLL